MKTIQEFKDEKFKEWTTSNKKVEILGWLKDMDRTFENLCDITGMSSALLCYYVNGNKKSKGMLEEDLVEKVFVDKTKTNYVFKITKLGLEVLKQ